MVEIEHASISVFEVTDLRVIMARFYPSAGSWLLLQTCVHYSVTAPSTPQTGRRQQGWW